MENFKKSSHPIKNWSADEQPREKLKSKGAASLSNSELLAILISEGYREYSALDISRALLRLSNHNLNELGKLSLNSLKKIKGIGEVKAIMITAALELGRRRHAALPLDKITVRSSSDIAVYLQTTIQDFTYEVFAVIFLNQANKINHFEIISKGGITGTVADPRIILRKALDHEATSLILCHNHPSGNLKPSRADEELTYKIKEAARYFDIRVLDHLIVSELGYYSFADEGLL